MDYDKLTALCNHLEQEIDWVTSLCTLLVEEKEILATRKFHELEDCISRKQDLSGKLEESAKQRLQLFNASIQNTEFSLENYLENCTDTEINKVTVLNKRLAENLKRCHDLNTVNGQVIANNLYVRQEIINTLSGHKTEAVRVYNSHGNLTSAKDNNHHQEA